MKMFIFILISVGSISARANLNIRGVEWKSCSYKIKRCYVVKASELSTSLLSKKLYARDVTLQIYKGQKVISEFQGHKCSQFRSGWRASVQFCAVVASLAALKRAAHRNEI